MYYDNNSDSAIPLCGRPECLHDDRDCNAYCGYDDVLTIQFYNGKLYYVTEGLDVMVMECDGSKHRLIYNLFDAEFPRSNTYWYFHHGYLIVRGDYNYISNGDPQCRREIRAYSLEEEKDYISIYKEDVSLSEQRLYMAQQPQEEHLYIVTCKKDIPGEDAAGESLVSTPVDYTVTDWNMNALSLNEKFHFELSEEDPYRGPAGILKTDEGFWISCQGGMFLYSSDGKLQKELTVEGNPDLLPTKRYIISLGYTDISWKQLRVIAADYSENVLLDRVIKAENANFGMDFYGADDDALYVMHRELGENKKIVFGKYSLRDGSYKKIWSSK